MRRVKNLIGNKVKDTVTKVLDIMAVKAVIFDLDGTIVDTEKYYRQFWPKAMAELGYTLTDEQALELRSLGRPFAPAKFKEWYGDDFDYWKARNLRKDMMEEYFDKEGICCKAGAKELLTYLKENGITTAIATASDLERTEKYLNKVGLSDYFDKLISATMVEEGKPSPDIYKYACEQLGLASWQCIAVEDSPNGVLSAFHAGCKVIMVPDQTQPDEELNRYLYKCVDSLEDIITIMEEEKVKM